MSDERFLVVRIDLEVALRPSRMVGLMHAIKQHPGVVSVANLESITPETLQAIMLAPEPVAALEPRVEQLELSA